MIVSLPSLLHRFFCLSRSFRISHSRGVIALSLLQGVHQLVPFRSSFCSVFMRPNRTEPATQTLFVCVCASSLLNPFRSIFDVFERFAHSQSTRDRVAADMTSEMCIALKEKAPIMGPDYEVALPLCCPRQCHSCPVECGKGEERVIIIKKQPNKNTHARTQQETLIKSTADNRRIHSARGQHIGLVT